MKRLIWSTQLPGESSGPEARNAAPSLGPVSVRIEKWVRRSDATSAVVMISAPRKRRANTEHVLKLTTIS